VNWQQGFITLILISSLNLFTRTSYAQDAAPAASAPKKPAAGSGGDKRTQSINFEDELVEGEVKKPELLYLLQKKQFNFKRLIKLRENFLPEMNRTTEDVGRGKGQTQ